MKKRDVIVVIGFNRPKSIDRVLNRLSECHFSKPIDLIVSIDFSEKQSDIACILENFKWNYGDFEFILHQENLGLRNHIISCGDLVEGYEGIIMFEDDIFPSEYFYNFITEVKKKLGHHSKIGGISLYTPQINEMVELPFIPLKADGDCFLLQSASSWGQYWTQEMWISFKKWYLKNQTLLKENDLPIKIYSWPESSWKKYFMKYLVVSDKYFVYPYDSLTTNFSDIGQHVTISSPLYQVPLNYKKEQFDIKSFDQIVKYDSFYELISVDYEKYCFDLYGSKTNFEEKDFLITKQILNYRIVDTFNLALKPHEMNVILKIPGEQIFLYDLKNKSAKKNTYKLKRNPNYYTNTNYKDSLVIGFTGIFERLKAFLKNKK